MMVFRQNLVDHVNASTTNERQIKGRVGEGSILNISLHLSNSRQAGIDTLGITSVVQDTRVLPLYPGATPAGFHAHRLPSLDSERKVMLRNWTRSLKPSRRHHIMVIDDDPRVLAALGRLLDDEGYDATLSSHIPCYEDIRRLRPDMVIADASYNRGYGGISLFDTPPVNRHNEPIPLIYSTVLPDVARRMTSTGKTILLKPFDLDDVLERIAHALY